MQWDWKKPRVGLRELLWLLGLILLLIYAFLPIRRAGNTSDPVASQLRNLQDGSTSERRTAVVELARQADREADRVVPCLSARCAIVIRRFAWQPWVVCMSSSPTIRILQRRQQP